MYFVAYVIKKLNDKKKLDWLKDIAFKYLNKNDKIGTLIKRELF